MPSFGPVSSFPVSALGAEEGSLKQASATISASGDLSAAAIADFAGAGTITGQGDLSAAAIADFAGAGTITGQGDLSAAAIADLRVSGTILGQGDLSANAVADIRVVGTITGQGDLSAAAIADYAGSGAINGEGDLSANATAHFRGAGTINGEGDLSCAPHVTRHVSGTISCSGDLSASARAILRCSGTITGQGDLSGNVESGEIKQATATITGQGDLSGSVVVIKHVAGTITGQGSLSAMPAHKYTGDGGIICYGSAETSLVINAGFDSSWGIEATIEAGFDSSWDAGETELRYYRILGKCTGANCNDVGVNPNDAKCGGVDGTPDGVRFMTVLAARNLADLCTRARNLQYTPPIRTQIERIDLLTRPVFKRGVAEANNAFDGQTVGIDPPPIDETCNVLTPLDFCGIPECIEFCVAEKPTITAGVTVHVTEAFFNYTGTGGISLSGSAEKELLYFYCTDGDMELSGSAEVVSPSFTYVGEGGMELSGDMSGGFYVFPLLREGSGGITLGGSAGGDIVSPYWSYTGDGGIVLGGSAEDCGSCRGDSWCSPRVTMPHEVSEGYLLLSGEAEVEGSNWHFSEVGEGGMILTGEAECLSSYYQYVGDGGIVLSGIAPTVSPYHEYTGDGEIELTGSARTGRQAPASGEMELSGTAEVNLIFAYEMDGTIILEGTVGGDVVSPFYTYQGSGNIELEGEAELDSSLLGTFAVQGGAYFTIENIEVEFDELLASSDLTIDDNLVTTTCGCGPSPLVLLGYHNLDKGNILKEFLAANGLSLGANANLRYRTANSSWQQNYHLSGRGLNGGNERWMILMEWSCSDNIAGEELGSSFWKFSMLITRSNLSTGLDTETRLLVTIPPDFVCTDSGLIDLEMKFNPQNGTVSLRRGDPDVVIFKDRIGIFKGRYWQQNLLKIFIKEQVASNVAPVYDIQPIFPVSI